LVQVTDLCVEFPGQSGPVRAVDGVSLTIHEREAVGLVGESGSGKSVTAFSLLGLIPAGGSIVGGRVQFRGRALAAMSPRELRGIRGNQIGMVFQEPAAALDPVFRIGDQIAETIRQHRKAGRKEAWQLAVDGLARVGVPDAAQRARDYPHELSGGLRQRAMIAVALAADPCLLVADEPTTALDVTVQAQILDLFARIRREREASLLLISHDLDVVAQVVERVLVMVSGRVVESAPCEVLFDRARHPYTLGLLRSRPSLDAGRGGRLPVISGAPGAVVARGCCFQDRCEYVQDRCRDEVPELRGAGTGHQVACLRFEEIS